MCQSIERDVDIASIASPLPIVSKLLYFGSHVLNLYLAQSGFVLFSQRLEIHHFGRIEAVPLGV
jgi:hypothetical protein